MRFAREKLARGFRNTACRLLQWLPPLLLLDVLESVLVGLRDRPNSPEAQQVLPRVRGLQLTCGAYIARVEIWRG